jgi:hypothetical protein
MLMPYPGPPGELGKYRSEVPGIVSGNITINNVDPEDHVGFIVIHVLDHCFDYEFCC